MATALEGLENNRIYCFLHYSQLNNIRLFILFNTRKSYICSISVCGTTNENSLDCRACTDGSAKRRSLDERSVLGVTWGYKIKWGCVIGFVSFLSQSYQQEF